MNENRDGITVSAEKLKANRRNAQLSTGPRTDAGKSQSRRNALRHGILASALLITKGDGAEDPAEFEELMSGLHRDLAPVGALEEMMVENVAVCLWRQKRALRCEACSPGRELFFEGCSTTAGSVLDFSRSQTSVDRKLFCA